MEKTTPINPITVSIRGPLRKMGGHDHETGVVTEAIQGGYRKDMLIFRFHAEPLNIFHF